jgi:hypothetical protein
MSAARGHAEDYFVLGKNLFDFTENWKSGDDFSDRHGVNPDPLAILADRDVEVALPLLPIRLLLSLPRTPPHPEKPDRREQENQEVVEPVQG